MVEVVTFTGTFTHTSEHGITTVSLSDVVDQLHHVHRLTHTGATKEANLTTLSERADQVDHFDTSFQQFDGSGEFIKFRGFTVNFARFFCANFATVVNRTTEHIHNAAEGLRANWHGDTATSARNLHATLQAFRRAHGNGTNHAVAQLLLHFKCQAGFGQGIAFVFFQNESFVNLRHSIARELNVHHGANDLNDLSDTHGFSSVIEYLIQIKTQPRHHQRFL